MKLPRALVLAAALLLVGILAGTAVSQAVFQPARLAFVDVAQVFQKCSRASAVEQQARDELRAVDMELKKAYEELKKKQAELDLVLPDTAEFQTKKREIDFEAFRLDYEEKSRKAKILEDAAKRMNLVYTLIRNEADNYARRNGLDGVFMVNNKQIEARSLEQLQLLVATRPILYWNNAYDITQPIVDVLNKP